MTETALSAAGTNEAVKTTLDIVEIQKILPHRYPFLLIDRVIEIQRKERIVALKNVTVNEPFFAGHFPGFPIMPGVLMVEAMAQAGGALLLTEIPDREHKLMVFTGHRARALSAAGNPWRSIEDRGDRTGLAQHGGADAGRGLRR